MAANSHSIQYATASSQYLTVPENAAFAPSAYTMEAWVKSGSNTYGAIIGKDISGQRQYFWYIDQTTHKVVIEHQGTPIGSSTNTFPLDGAWHHVAITVSSGVLQAIYVDTVSVAITAGTTTAMVDANTPFNIGRRAFTSFEQYFDGLIDEVRFWNVVRTGTQIANNWKSDVTGQTGLVAFWQCNEGSGTTTADATGNGNTATLTNSPTWSTDVPFSNYGGAVTNQNYAYFM